MVRSLFRLRRSETFRCFQIPKFYFASTYEPSLNPPHCQLSPFYYKPSFSAHWTRCLYLSEMVCQGSTAASKFSSPFLYLALFVLSVNHYVDAVSVPIKQRLAPMMNTPCLGYPEADNNADRTVLEVLKRMGVQDKNKFDKNGNNYNLFSRMLYDANLHKRLDDPNEELTIIIVNDISVKTSVKDIVNEFNLGSNVQQEADAYAVLSSRLPRLYSWPAAVRAAIIRNHILSAKLLPCEFTNAKYWITWANQNVTRFGYMIHSEDSLFPKPNLDITFMAIEAKNGVIYQFDRLVMPDLSGFSPAVTPTPSVSTIPSPPVSPPVSPSTDAGSRPRPSTSTLPTAVSPSPTTMSSIVSPTAESPPSPPTSKAPSLTPIPKLSQPLSTFSPEAVGQTPGPTQNDRDSGEPGMSQTTAEPNSGSGSGTCFPADMRVRLSATETRTMDKLNVGDRVYISSVKKDSVIGFSHRVNSQNVFPFVRIDTTTLLNVTLSHGHLVYVNGKFIPAKDTRVGDSVKTEAGLAVVTSVKDVWSKGLYAPHTLGGDLMVNGVSVSCYTTVFPETTAHTLLTPVRALFKTNLVHNPLGPILNNGIPQNILTKLSQLTWSLSSLHRWMTLKNKCVYVSFWLPINWKWCFMRQNRHRRNLCWLLIVVPIRMLVVRSIQTEPYKQYGWSFLRKKLFNTRDLLLCFFKTKLYALPTVIECAP